MNTLSKHYSSPTIRRGLVLSGALVLLASFQACSEGNAQSGAGAPSSVQVANGKGGEKAVAIKVETLQKAPLVLTLPLTGTVEAGRIAQLASPAEGPVLQVRVREGDRVDRGQVLVNLGRTDGANALVRSLNEDLKKEEDNLSRTRHLIDSGALPAEQLDTATANAVRVRAQLIKAQEGSRDYAVSAPWAGVVSKMKVRDGDFVAPRAPLAEIYDPQSLIVRLSVPEQAAAGVAQGAKVAVELDAYPEKRFAGRVVRLYPYLDTRTRTRIVEVSLTDVPTLLPGMFARVNLEQSTIPDAITVPAYSVLAAPGGKSIAFVVQDGKAVRRAVETGVEKDGRVRIVSGLEACDKLIVAGHEKLKDGASVKVADGNSEKAAADPGNKTASGMKLATTCAPAQSQKTPKTPDAAQNGARS